MSRYIFAMLCIVLVASAHGCHAEEHPTPHVELTLSAERESIASDDIPRIEFTLRNVGDDTISLVRPGDGSDVGWRTPILEWSVVKLEDPTAQPRPILRCGNMNALGPGEVFELAPGDAKSFTSFVNTIPFDSAPGIYEVTLTYTNDPKMKWGGVPHGFHNWGEKRRATRLRFTLPRALRATTNRGPIEPATDALIRVMLPCRADGW